MAVWNGIAPSPPIMPRHSNIRSSRSRVPVLALGGDQRFGSRMVPMLREFASNVTGGSIERCSHYVADERPDEVAAALIGFLTAN